VSDRREARVVEDRLTCPFDPTITHFRLRGDKVTCQYPVKLKPFTNIRTRPQLAWQSSQNETGSHLRRFGFPNRSHSWAVSFDLRGNCDYCVIRYREVWMADLASDWEELARSILWIEFYFSARRVTRDLRVVRVYSRCNCGRTLITSDLTGTRSTGHG
jgi:hypothetical protein